jgi:glycosyltransferase involved in cell wall biosynthesis
MKKISIIIPTYNSSAYVEDAINCVLNQSYKNIEIIVIDDGSTDNTEEILQKYSDDKKILYIKKKNGGPASARNIGLKIASGEYIALLDADDIWDKDKLTKQISFLENGNFDLVHTNRFFIDDATKKEWISYTPYTTKHLIRENFIINSSVLLKTNILKQNLFKEDRAFFAIEDYDLWLRLAFKGYKFGHLERKLTGYRIHQKQISSVKNLENLIFLYKKNISETNNFYYKLLLLYMYFKMNLYEIRLKFK